MYKCSSTCVHVCVCACVCACACACVCVRARAFILICFERIALNDIKQKTGMKSPDLATRPISWQANKNERRKERKQNTLELTWSVQLSANCFPHPRIRLWREPCSEKPSGHCKQAAATDKKTADGKEIPLHETAAARKRQYNQHCKARLT